MWWISIQILIMLLGRIGRVQQKESANITLSYCAKLLTVIPTIDMSKLTTDYRGIYVIPISSTYCSPPSTGANLYDTFKWGQSTNNTHSTIGAYFCSWVNMLAMTLHFYSDNNTFTSNSSIPWVRARRVVGIKRSRALKYGSFSPSAG